MSPRVKTPQIFVIYEGGMFGTFLCNLFLDHPLCNFRRLKEKAFSNPNDITAHSLGYIDMIDKFHQHMDIVHLLEKDETFLRDFFRPLNNYTLGVNRIASYYAINLDLQNHFENYIRIIIRPKNKARIKYYAKRFSKIYRERDHDQFWFARNLKKKRIEDIPKHFLDVMATREYTKYQHEHTEYLDRNYRADPGRDVIFDPDDINNKEILTKIIMQSCRLLNIQNFKPNFQYLETLLEKNKDILNLKGA